MKGLKAADLRKTIDPKKLPFKSTSEVKESVGYVGQSRALDAIELGSSIRARDFNVFVSGTSGTGRHRAVEQILKRQVEDRPTPGDWVFVNNFDKVHKPIAIGLPAGLGPMFREEMAELVRDVATDLPTAFESNEYGQARGTLEQEFASSRDKAIASLAEEAKGEDVAIMQTQRGLMLGAIIDGKVAEGDQIRSLPPEQQAEIQSKLQRWQMALGERLKDVPKQERATRKSIEKLNRDTVAAVVEARLDDFPKALTDIEPVAAFLEAVNTDMVKNFELFLQAEAAEQNPQMAGPAGLGGAQRVADPVFDRYEVNVMIATDPKDKQPVPIVFEALPTLENLVGRVEMVGQLGAMTSNFTLIKPGALHRANGGFLVMDARNLLMEPHAYDVLKVALKNQEISLPSFSGASPMVPQAVLEPAPIPLDVRVVLIGDRMIYGSLLGMDPDFADLFKIQADFEDSTKRSEDSLEQMAIAIAQAAQENNIRPMKAASVARLLDESVRTADDNERFSLRMTPLLDTLREAEHYSLKRGGKSVEPADIDEAVKEAAHRSSRIKELMHENVLRETVLIDTDGDEVGQINGLAVLGMANFSFGKASRITARVRMGTGKLVDIEREVALGGPLHSKGVMIISHFLTSHYALDLPFSLHASLAFEQSYGLVDGDSASSAELFALLSALSEVPIHQGFACTGSVNQLGEVQAIGGVNEKIEGFFDLCFDRGLTGTQGVLIPHSNVKNLMLRPDVVQAVKDGAFNVYPIKTIDEGITILTGKTAGKRGTRGAFTRGSINALVEERLRDFASKRLDLMRNVVP